MVHRPHLGVQTGPYKSYLVVVGRERTTHCVVSAYKSDHRTVHCMVHNPWGTHSTVQYQYGVPPTVPATVHIGLRRPYVVHSLVHYTTNGTLYGTLKVCHRGTGPYAVPYMVHRGLFRPSSTYSMVHSTVSCTLDGTFVPFQRLRVTLSGTPLGTQWYTGYVPRDVTVSYEKTTCSAWYETVVSWHHRYETQGRRFVFLASPSQAYVPIPSGRCVVFLAPPR